MSLQQQSERQRPRLKISFREESEGIKQVNLYPDFVSPHNPIDIVTRSTYNVSDYLRNILAPVSCPRCNAKKLNLRVVGGMRERFLKIMGRRVFLCPHCETTQVLKVHRWEWEIVGTALAICGVVLFFSIQWAFR